MQNSQVNTEKKRNCPLYDSIENVQFTKEGVTFDYYTLYGEKPKQVKLSNAEMPGFEFWNILIGMMGSLKGAVRVALSITEQRLVPNLLLMADEKKLKAMQPTNTEIVYSDIKHFNDFLDLLDAQDAPDKQGESKQFYFQAAREYCAEFRAGLTLRDYLINDGSIKNGDIVLVTEKQSDAYMGIVMWTDKGGLINIVVAPAFDGYTALSNACTVKVLDEASVPADRVEYLKQSLAWWELKTSEDREKVVGNAEKREAAKAEREAKAKELAEAQQVTFNELTGKFDAAFAVATASGYTKEVHKELTESLKGTKLTKEARETLKNRLAEFKTHLPQPEPKAKAEKAEGEAELPKSNKRKAKAPATVEEVEAPVAVVTEELPQSNKRKKK